MMAKMIKQVRSEPAQSFECLQVHNGTVLESLHAQLRKECDAEIKQLFCLGKIVSQSLLNRNLVSTEHLGTRARTISRLLLEDTGTQDIYSVDWEEPGRVSTLGYDK